MFTSLRSWLVRFVVRSLDKLDPVEIVDTWNSPTYWQAYYHDLLKDAGRRDSVAHRRVECLMRMLTEAGQLPCTSRQTLLDAGCGIAIIPNLLAYWGFQVTALDACARAIEVAAQARPTEEDLARCVPVLEPVDGSPGVATYVNDPDRSLQRLRDFKAAGGSVSYVAGDWLTADLPLDAFGVIYCRNGLKESTAAYWKQSLLRFHELLAPGGILLLENLNALDVRDEVMGLPEKCGFVPLVPGQNPEPSRKYVIDFWPTG